jgi:cell division protein FtsB
MYLESRKVQLMETVARMKQQQILKEIAKQLHNMSERLDQFIKIQGEKAAKLDFSQV